MAKRDKLFIMSRYFNNLKKIIIFSLFLSFLPFAHLQAAAQPCPMQECVNITAQSDDATEQTIYQSHCNLCFMIVSDYSFGAEYSPQIPTNAYFAYRYSYIYPLITPPPII